MKLNRAIRRARRLIQPYAEARWEVESVSCGTETLTRLEWLYYTIAELWAHRREYFCDHEAVRTKLIHDGSWHGNALSCKNCHANMGGEGEY